MALKIDPKVVYTVLLAIRNSPGGATLNDVMAAFSERPDRRIAHRWLAALIREGVLDVDTSAKAYRYVLRYDPFEPLDPSPNATEAAASSGTSSVPTVCASREAE
jgi:hypothetical protein